MDEATAAAMLQARVDLLEREIAALPPPPRSTYAEHQEAIARVVCANWSVNFAVPAELQKYGGRST